LADHSLQQNEAKELMQKLGTCQTAASDYDKILINNELKLSFFRARGDYDVNIGIIKKLNRNATVRELFDELNAVKQSIDALNEQLAATIFSQNKIIEGTAQNVDALIEKARSFFETWSGKRFDQIQSQPFIDIIDTALKTQNFEETIGFLEQWFIIFNLHAYTMLTFQTVLQSINQRRKILFIGPSELCRFILTMRYYLLHNDGSNPPEEIVNPTNQKFTEGQVNKALHRIGKVLHAVPTHTCQTCGSCQIDLQLCSRCKKVRYCSVDCQKKDWLQHKLVCH